MDGSTLPITSEIKDNKTTIRKANNSDKPFSAFHLNTSYDILEYAYDDIVLQGQSIQDERDALNKMVERYKGEKAIFIATGAMNPSTPLRRFIYLETNI